MEKGYVRLPQEALRRFSSDVFVRSGFSREEAEVISGVLLQADLWGIESHGVQRLMMYRRYLDSGMVDPGGRPETVLETPATAVVDGHGGMGQLIAAAAMGKAIEKAKKVGVGIVSVRNSNHYGIAGYYAMMACREGLIGMSCTNSEAIMVPTGGRLAMLGSNPIAVAAPAEPCDFLFDASTTVVTRGKLEVYRKRGELPPAGWMLDPGGRPTRDIPSVLASVVAKRGGGIVPLGGEKEETGGHKGYGFAMVCELFSSVLSMGATSNYAVTGGKGNTCHGFAAVDPACFGDPEEIKRRLSEFMEELRASPKAEGCGRIYTHGEKEAGAERDRMKNGVPVNGRTLAEFGELAERFGLRMGDYFPAEAAQ